jgi:site-specific DNA recombinase
MDRKPRGVRLVRLSKTADPTSTSVDRQIEITDRLAADLDTDIVGEAIDRSVSAFKIPPQERKQFKLWLDDDNPPPAPYDRFLCWRLDRVFRNVFDFTHMVEWCRKNGKGIYASDKGNMDLTTDEGILVGFIGSWQANQESKSSSARVTGAQDYLARVGRYRGGRKPYGYHSICICHDKTRCPINEPSGWKLVPDEQDRAPKIREAARRVISGESIHAVVVDFNRRGILTSDGKMWLAATMRKVLSNPAMIGLLGKDGLTGGEEFGQLKLAIKERTINRQVRTLDRSSLLLDVVFCGECGGKVYRWYRKERNKYYGRCRNEMKRGQVAVVCRAPMVPYGILEKRVTEDLLTEYGTWLIETRITDATRAMRADSIDRELIELAAEFAAKRIDRIEFTKRQGELLDEQEALEAAENAPEWSRTGDTVAQRWGRLSEAERRLWLLRIGLTWRVWREDSGEWTVLQDARSLATFAARRERIVRPD